MRLQIVSSAEVNKAARFKTAVSTYSPIEEFLTEPSKISIIIMTITMKTTKNPIEKPIKFDKADKANDFPKPVQPFLLSQTASANVKPMTSMQKVKTIIHSAKVSELVILWENLLNTKILKRGNCPPIVTDYFALPTI